MQCRDGGFAAFDADNTRALCRELPFCDFGEVIDPPSADVTAHVLETLALEGRRERPARAARAALAAARAGAGRLVVRALGREPPLRHRRGRAGARGRRPAGRTPGDPARRALARRASRTTTAASARTCAPTTRCASRASAPRPPSQTAWALLALLAAGERGAPTQRAVAWLARAQRADGDWDEPQFTGTGFPGDFYIRYHLYRLSFPLMALGRFLAPEPATRS